jgi:hypothetical protein
MMVLPVHRAVSVACLQRTSIVGLLLDVLSTPSEAVQRAVSNCLPRLLGPLADNRGYVEALLARLLGELREGGPGGYGLRRGAAYGLSGAVKGLGIGSLKGYGVLDSLKAMVEDKRDAQGREGSLQAFECLCEKLGRLFEPYVIHILPLLLQCFGDAAPQVRAAMHLFTVLGLLLCLQMCRRCLPTCLVLMWRACCNAKGVQDAHHM